MTLIDLHEGKLTLRVGQEEVTFNILQSTNYSNSTDNCFRINTVDKCVRGHLDDCGNKFESEHEHMLDDVINTNFEPLVVNIAIIDDEKSMHEKIVGTPYHPQMSGQVDISDKELKRSRKLDNARCATRLLNFDMKAAKEKCLL
ncbi:hypothetical protein MANES_11G091056v8 [Manihot esculenta]|uniref:Uncharacterized protein n=1 Tax=Manihot esculenta TaxID=3983 RepID=A0ACB7GZB0_MANES|nr:hypothetical protein MANES_11G091056v8 [Manihot esculenta]